MAVGPDGVPSFERLCYRRGDSSVVLFAFDLIELGGDDLRREPIERRKARLAKILSRAGPRIQLNEYIEEDGVTVFEHACKLGFEGIVSKRKGSPYSSGRSPHWLKSKNPGSAAVQRELTEDWGHDEPGTLFAPLGPPLGPNSGPGPSSASPNTTSSRSLRC